MQAGVYRHYKGNYYQVLGVAQHTETGELMVVYVSLEGADQMGPRLRVRPMNGPDGFCTPVKVGICDEPRFIHVGDRIK